VVGLAARSCVGSRQLQEVSWMAITTCPGKSGPRRGRVRPDPAVYIPRGATRPGQSGRTHPRGVSVAASVACPRERPTVRSVNTGCVQAQPR